MLSLSSWKVWGICLLGVGGIALAVPSLLSSRSGPGSQLILEADTRAVASRQAEMMEDALRSEMRRGGIAVSGLQAGNGEVRFLVDVPAQLPEAEALVRRQIGQVPNARGPDWTVQVSEGGQIVMRQTQAAATDSIRLTMEATRDVIARRIEALGAGTPTVAVQGTNRILVQVPGALDLESVKRLIGRTARLQFKLVEILSLPCNTPRRPGIQYLPADELAAGQCMGVQSRALVGDEQISDARQDYDESGQVAVRVSFDVQGAQRFAQITQANVGRRFAIVLDNRIISAPMISEPILGGTASIAGGFTAESANQLAISLRTGRLPVELHVVNERTAGSDNRPAGAKAAND